METGLKNAISTFNYANKNIIAYKKFLLSKKFNKNNIKDIEGFKNVPITDKNNYIRKFSLNELFPKNKISQFAYASSGSSGKPTFWFRGDKEDITGGKIHEIIVKNIFNLNKNEETLVVICFSMGVWIAGNYTLDSFRHISRLGYNITTISPGIEREDIINIFKHLAPKFDNLIIAGYPPFLMDVINESLKRKITFKNKKINIITAGDKVTENWRIAFLERINKGKYSHSLIGIYGCADAGILGHETPLSIQLRKEAISNRQLYKELFGNEKNVPGLVQYHPEHIYFEEINNELIFTSNLAQPLIRYNIHDVGRVVTYSEIKKIINKYHLEKKLLKYGLHEWKLPFIVIKGRTDVATTFYAINILPEYITNAIEHKKISKFLTGNFFVHNKTLNNQKNQKLIIRLELAKNIKITKKIIYDIENIIFNSFMDLSIEFRKLYGSIGHRAIPNIILHKHDDNKIYYKSSKGLLNIKGKKPKVVIN